MLCASAQSRAASARQQIATARAARLRDAIGIREREQSADVGVRLRARCGFVVPASSCRSSTSTLRNARVARAAVDPNVGRDVRIVDAPATQSFDSQAQIGVAPASAPAQQIAFAQHCGDLQREALQAELGAAHDHVCEPRMRAQSRQRAAMRA